jgi:hypothetical protein
VIFSDSQLRFLDRQALDGSSGTQIFSMSGGTINRLRDVLDDFRNTSNEDCSCVKNVVLMLGGNDARNCNSHTVFGDELNLLIVVVAAIFRNADLYVLSLLLRPDTSPTMIDTLNGYIEKLPTVRFVDVSSGLPQQCFRLDGVHLNFQGVLSICRSLRSLLQIRGNIRIPLLKSRFSSRLGTVPFRNRSDSKYRSPSDRYFSPEHSSFQHSYSFSPQHPFPLYLPPFNPPMLPPSTPPPWPGHWYP